MRYIMNLAQINQLWEEYKKKYDIKSDARITRVLYDTGENVEGCFNLLELMAGDYVLHLNPNMHLYSENYCKFILFHEFTHFYDYIHRPYSEDEKEKLIMWMNAYSEFHACRVTLARFIEMIRLTTVDVDKIQIPGQYKEISIRQLLMESIYRCQVCFFDFYISNNLADYANGLRSLMYLMGYVSLFVNDEDMIAFILKGLRLESESFMHLYMAMKETRFDDVLTYYKIIVNDATLVYIKEAFRRYYSREIISEEEIEEVTLENFRDYIRMVNERLREMGYDVEDPEDLEELEKEDSREAAYRIMDTVKEGGFGLVSWFDYEHLILK
ncbi:MAG: hypothetical protein IJI25_04700 [Eubacterium sp.]|nr:hypothetical protein [Eubacterium sp.]